MMKLKRLTVTAVAGLVAATGLLGFAALGGSELTASAAEVAPSSETSDYVRYSAIADQLYALNVCRVEATNPNYRLRLSSNGIFVPNSSGSLWYTNQSSVYLPVNSAGEPAYVYAAAFQDDLQLGMAYHPSNYVVKPFDTPVTEYTASYIPDSYDIDGVNVWAHGGGDGDTIKYTILYEGKYRDDALDVKTEESENTFRTGHYVDGEEVILYVRVRRYSVSIRANIEVYLGREDAFAFRVE